MAVSKRGSSVKKKSQEERIATPVCALVRDDIQRKKLRTTHVIARSEATWQSVVYVQAAQLSGSTLAIE